MSAGKMLGAPGSGLALGSCGDNLGVYKPAARAVAVQAGRSSHLSRAKERARGEGGAPALSGYTVLSLALAAVPNVMQKGTYRNVLLRNWS